MSTNPSLSDRPAGGFTLIEMLIAIGVPSVSSAGHYTLQVLNADSERYELVAVATGNQARDTACRQLKLTFDGATVTHASGSDELVANATAVNRRCWSM